VGKRAQCVTIPPTGITARTQKRLQTKIGEVDRLVILRGDVPLLRQETLERLLAQQEATDAALATLEGAPGAGLISGVPNTLWTYLPQADLADLSALVTLAAQQGERVATVPPTEAMEALRVTDRQTLSAAGRALRDRINEHWMNAGVTITDPATTYIGPGVTIGQDSIIQPNTHLRGETKIGEESVIGPNTIIKSCKIGRRCTVLASVLQHAVMEDESDIGPFGRLRKGAHLKRGVHMGSFGEVKNSTLGEDVHMGHFSYVGDADVGPRVNLSAGIITCNYDGRNKHRTTIGRDAFVGSGTLLVAPVELGDEAHTGAGAVVTRDVPAGKLAYGVPARIKGTSPLSSQEKAAPQNQEEALEDRESE
jgi:bifunctional UDP-N-acetylglucosamine pyrophosphorylase/glucosamine-1-phosphate N-acetyltransferase